MTCAESRQNARQTENQIHHYESSYQRNHYESTYERTSTTSRTSRNDELYFRNLLERRQREQNMNILFSLLCICAFLIWAITQGYQNRNKKW